MIARTAEILLMNHHLRPLLLTLTFLLFAAHLPTSAADPVKTYWYEFEVKDRGTIAATSTLEPENLAAALAEGGFIRFANVRRMSVEGKWHTAVAPYTDALFIRREQIKAFIPLEAPPQDYDPKATK